MLEAGQRPGLRRESRRSRSAELRGLLREARLRHFQLSRTAAGGGSAKGRQSGKSCEERHDLI